MSTQNDPEKQTDFSRELTQYEGKIVVFDMQSTYVLLGTLVGGDHRYLILENADVHDLRDTSTTRERYVLDAKMHGVSVNRKQVFVRREEIISLSLLDDVLC